MTDYEIFHVTYDTPQLFHGYHKPFSLKKQNNVFISSTRLDKNQSRKSQAETSNVLVLLKRFKRKQELETTFTLNHQA